MCYSFLGSQQYDPLWLFFRYLYCYFALLSPCVFNSHEPNYNPENKQTSNIQIEQITYIYSCNKIKETSISWKGNKKAYMRGFEEKKTVKEKWWLIVAKYLFNYVKMCWIFLIICKNVLLFYLVCLRRLISLTKSSTTNSEEEV